MKKRQRKKEYKKLNKKQKYIGYIENAFNKMSLDYNYMKNYDYNKEQDMEVFCLSHEEFKKYHNKLFRKIITCT